MSTNNDPIRVGIIGLGRSGWAIHTKAIRQMDDTYRIVAVHDPIDDRCKKSAEELGVRAHGTLDALLRDEEVELAIVASTNGFHAEQATQALKAGKHVLCEKPFGLTVADVDMMMAAAKEAGTVLQPFQQRRYEPDFLKVTEICDSGLIGEISYIRICWHGFKRRWDWQTMKTMAGGALNNNGPHPIDHAMELFGDGEPVVECEMRRILCSGDAEDFLRVTLTGEGKPTIVVELIDNAAYGHDRWWICGSSGGLKGNADGLEWKWVDFSTMPERSPDPNPTPDRSYNKEELAWQEDSWKPEEAADAGAGAAPSPQPVLDLYAGMYRAIREGAPQEVTPESVRRRVAVLEKVRNASGFYK